MRDQYIQELLTKLATIHEFVRDKNMSFSNRMKTRYDILADHSGFHENDKVWFYNAIWKKGINSKLKKQWEGTYIVAKRIKDAVYRIRRILRSKLKVKMNMIRTIRGSSVMCFNGLGKNNRDNWWWIFDMQ